MSIQIELVGHVPGALLSNNTPSASLEAIREWFEKQFSLAIWSKHAEETSYAMSFHPLADPIKFEIEGKTIQLKAFTEGPGPGYHAKVVDVLDQISAATHVKWHEREPHIDHAGYFSNRDFARLKNYFTRWLRHTCLHVVDRPESRTGIPLGLKAGAIEYPGYALTALGPRPREWVQAIASGSALGEDYWAWPEKELNPKYYVRFALSIMWSQVDWHSVQSNRQKMMMVAAEVALVKAFSLDPGNTHIPWQA